MPEEKIFNAIRHIIESLEIVGGLMLLSMEPGRISSRARQKRIDDFLEEKMFGKDKLADNRDDNRVKIQNKFYYLKKRGLVNVEYRGNQIYISLTDEGKRRAGKYKIDDLKIKTAENWDKKWRVLIFDVEENYRIKREALRGKIKELGLYQLQKSVWVCPYEFKKEMSILRDFFGLEKGDMKVITAVEIEDDQPVRDFFGLK
jgi:CRISPR/Cas system-associated endoribonuclease Cas2